MRSSEGIMVRIYTLECQTLTMGRGASGVMQKAQGLTEVYDTSSAVHFERVRNAPCVCDWRFLGQIDPALFSRCRTHRRFESLRMGVAVSRTSMEETLSQGLPRI